MTERDRAGGVLTVDLDAVRENWRMLEGMVGPTAECAATVKADAYGLGIDRVAPALAGAGCRTFFVAAIDEGIALRRLVPDARIFVLNGPFPGTCRDFLEHRLVPVLNAREQVEAWTTGGCGGEAALHVDTGMNRLGLAEDELASLAATPGALSPILLMSHLACAEDGQSVMNAGQLARFLTARRLLPAVPASLANSSGIFLGPGYHFDMVRPGAALFGVSPRAGQPNPMRQVVRLQGKIVQLRDVDRPMTVGYGATHRVTGRGRVATVAVGYADGFPRSLSNRGCGHVGGVRVPLVGRVSMDLITFDVSEAPPEAVRPGAMIDLIGRENPVDAVADQAGTIGYEILTSLGHRYYRHYVGGAA
ncbi:MAG: alanine racemase [Rhodospirillales bacterium]|nr:alanine racemase [Rhodospirillales bacterium]